VTDRKLEIAFVDKEGKLYQIDEVDSTEIANALEVITKEIAARLRLQKEQR
jgi:hypothetical protein